LGGCPFAQDVLVGNLPTEIVMETLRKHGASQPPIKPLLELVAMSAKLGDQFGGPKM
jgi:hydroxymethylglutaryl-CoA lyase